MKTETNKPADLQSEASQNFSRSKNTFLTFQVNSFIKSRLKSVHDEVNYPLLFTLLHCLTWVSDLLYFLYL